MTHRSGKVLLFCLCATLVAVAPGQEKKDDAVVVKKADNLVEVTVTGMGMDKAEAIRDAQRKAIERGAGTYIYSHSEMKDFALVKDTVLARSAGFVQSMDILSAKEMDDKTWEVKIKVVVSIKGIEDTWGVVTNLLQQMGRPKIMVFVTEKITNDKGLEEIVEDSTVQTGIEAALLKSGFELVEKKQLKEIDKKDLSAAVAEDKPEKVQAIAKRFGAQLFISGSAHATPGDRKELVPGRIYYTYEAEGNIKCYASDTGKMLSAVPGKPMRGVQEVWRSAAKQALDSEAAQIAPLVQNDILRVWMDVLQGRGEVQMQVSNIAFKDYVKLKKALETIKEIKDIKADFANNNAEISIQTEMRAEKLAEKIVEAMDALEVTDITQNVIKAKFKAEK